MRILLDLPDLIRHCRHQQVARRARERGEACNVSRVLFAATGTSAGLAGQSLSSSSRSRSPTPSSTKVTRRRSRRWRANSTGVTWRAAGRRSRSKASRRRAGVAVLEFPSLRRAMPSSSGRLSSGWRPSPPVGKVPHFHRRGIAALCSRKSSSPTAARSPAGSSAPRSAWGSRRSRFIRTPTRARRM